MFEELIPFLMTQLIQLPVVIVYAIGLGFAISRRRMLGDAAAFAGVGFGVILIAKLISSAALFWQMHAYRNGVPPGDIATTVLMASWIARGFELVGVVFVVIGLLRRPQEPVPITG